MIILCTELLILGILGITPFLMQILFASPTIIVVFLFIDLRNHTDVVISWRPVATSGMKLFILVIHGVMRLLTVRSGLVKIILWILYGYQR